MWSDYSDNTGAFQNIENIEISDIQGTTGTQLVTSLISPRVGNQ